MASLIPGYEYDIFISYRQKDNKYDGWVTEFVSNLRKELDATFKEEISIYFDINPSDGLLETYNVDASLKDKLKCLIFIPIVSLTYCDPKSFAWQNEFIAFNKFAQNDQFGRDIRLANGNVTSRILPIKIHDLEPEDKELIEKELGGPLRAIEFIYKEFGVNRPLTPSDNPAKNQEKTFYRDQVNKVANSIKAIITALKNPASKPVPSGTRQSFKTGNAKHRKILLVIPFILLSAVAAYLLYRHFVTEKPGISANSIAVLYFENISSDPEQEYFSDGITEEIISHLSLIKDLRVTSRTSVIPYKGNRNAGNIREIAKQLNVENILEGSVRKAGEKLRITAELINAQADQHIWTEIYDRDLTDVFKIQSDIAHSIAEKFRITISPEANSQIVSVPTSNVQAYDLFLKARSISLIEGKGIGIYSGPSNRAIRLLKQAISLDPDFSQAYALCSQIYFSTDRLDSAVYMAKEAIIRNPKSPEGYLALSSTQKFEDALKTLGRLCDIDSAKGLLGMANQYLLKSMFPEAIKCYQNVIKSHPNINDSYEGMAVIYYYLAERDSMEKYLGLLSRVDPGSKEAHHIRLLSAEFSGQPELAKEEARKYFPDDTLSYNYTVGISYLFAKKWSQAENYYARTNYRDMDWGLVKIKTGKRDSGTVILNKALAFRGQGGWNGDLSRIHALLGNKTKAIAIFKNLTESGWFDLNWMRNDPYWDELRSESEFRKMTDEMERKKIEMMKKIRKIN